MKLTLPSGTTGFTNDQGQWICTGSQMGRPNILPEDRAKPCKLHIERLRMVDRCYDRWGAYWGAPANLYCAYAERPSCVSIMLNFDVLIFVRAKSRHEAKQLVRQQLPQAKFYH